MKKKTLAILLVLCMMLALVPTTASAESSTYVPHVPTTYIVGSNHSGDGIVTGCTTTMYDTFYKEGQLLYKGDTLRFIPDEYCNITNESTIEVIKYTGFRICTGDEDHISDFAEVISSYKASDAQNIYQEIKITSDNPIHLVPQYDTYTAEASVSSAHPYDPEHRKLVHSKKFVYCAFEYVTEPNVIIDLDGAVNYGDFDFSQIPTTIHYSESNYTFSLPTIGGYVDGKPREKMLLREGQAAYGWKTVEGSANGETRKFVGITDDTLVTVKSNYNAFGLINSATKYYDIIFMPEFMTEDTITLFANGGKIEGFDSKIYRSGIANGEDAEVGNYVSIADNETFNLSEHTPTRDGYTFAGWYYDETLSDPVDMNFGVKLSFAWKTANYITHLYAKWTPAPSTQHSVNVQSDGNGVATPSAYSAAAGTKVSLNVKENQNYHFKEWQVISGGVQVIDNSFEMPDNDVTIKAIFEENEPMPSSFSIESLPCANGSISADKTQAAFGDTVTMTVSPDDGYKLKSIQIFDELGQDWVKEAADFKIINNTFSMPPVNIRIQATFEKISPDGNTNELVGLTGKVHFETAIPDDCVLELREIPTPDSYKAKDGITAKLFNATVFRNGKIYPITDNKTSVTILLPNELTGKDVYDISFMNDDQELTENQKATENDNMVQFTSNHLGNFLVEAHTHNYVWITDKEPTATDTGLKHQECTICGEKQNENTVIPATGVEPHTHTLTHFAAKAATATAAGNIEYWYCSVCGKYFSDENGKNEITLTSTIIPPVEAGTDATDAPTADTTTAPTSTPTDATSAATSAATAAATKAASSNTSSSTATQTNTGSTTATTAAATQTANDSTTGKTAAAQTGDSSNVMLWVCLLFISGGVLGAVGITHKKRKYTKK